MTMTTTALRRMASVLFVFVLLGTACSGSSTTTISEVAGNDDADASVQAPEPTAEPEQAEEAAEPEPTAAPVATEPPAEPTATPEPELSPALIYFSTGIEPGDCFNRLEGNPAFTPPEKVSCDELHEEEVFAKGLLDDPLGTPYPGEDAVADRASAELCVEATVKFAGTTWELLPIATRTLFPIENEWDAGDRTIMCTAHSSLEGERKIGTAAGGTIKTADVLVARSGLQQEGVDFEEWAVFQQYDNIDTIGSLTDAQFDLPLRRSSPVPQGFMFNAKAAGDEGHATSTWGYNWTTAEFTDLGSILPGQELASTMVIDGSVIFAAREDPSDDWDLWSDAEVIVGGDGDQQYPTASPDGSKLVYQDNGDIWVADIDGSNRLQLTSGPANDYESIVSPDGTTVVFASDRTGDDELWAVAIDGSEPVNLTNHPGDESWPVFSADGQYIYFGTDRLDPENDRSYLMVMNADGSDQSWFGSVAGGQAMIVPLEFAAEVAANAPTLNERYSYELLEGDTGTTVTWTDSTGRLSVELPAGWRIAELNDAPGFVSGPHIDAYYEIWEVDGVLVSLWDGDTQDEFFARYDDATAVTSCEQFDGTDDVVPVGDGIVGLSGNFNCGDGAVGGVIMLYNTTTNVGVMIEGQRDNLPDVDADTEMLTAIARSLIWE